MDFNGVWLVSHSHFEGRVVFIFYLLELVIFSDMRTTSFFYSAVL